MSSEYQILPWLNGGDGVTRKNQIKAAEWLCDPNLIRQTEELEFTDLTNLNHRTKLELSDGLWPLLRKDSQAKIAAGRENENEQPGLVVLGFMRRGIPLQHTRARLRRGGTEIPLIRLKADATEQLALALLDNIWVRCSMNELTLSGEDLRGRVSGKSTKKPQLFIPRPFEFAAEDHEFLRSDPPSSLDGSGRYVNRFWREFLGIGARNVNADWTLLNSRFQLRESLWANALWRQPDPDLGEPKWSVERALLASLSARLAFSYILAAWVPPEACGVRGPIEVEFEFQERILTPKEQVKRIDAVKRRTKKSYERTLVEVIDGRKPDQELADQGLRLRYTPTTYLGLLDPALDDPDDGQRSLHPREPVDRESSRDFVERLSGKSLMRKWRLFGGEVARGISGRVRALGTFIWRRKASLVVSALGLLASVTLYFIAIRSLVIHIEDYESFTADILPGLLALFAASVLLGWFVSSRLAIGRRSTVVLPTWSGGRTSPIHEVITPGEFSVWQGILARPSNRGRSWKTRPAVELGRKSTFWWQDPKDRGHVPRFVAGRPHLLIIELRARMSRDLTLYGLILCGLAALLLLVPAVVQLASPERWAFLQAASADTVATIMLLLPTAGGALLVRPGEDPIASKLLRGDRMAVGIGAVMVSAIAVALVLFFGWPDSETPADGNAKEGKVESSLVERSVVKTTKVDLNGSKRPTDTNASMERSQTKTTSSDDTVDQDPAFWTLWFVLGSIALVMAIALSRGFLQTRNVDQPQPDGKQGTGDASRRSPLDVPAPLPSLDYRWGRRFARRTLLRLAPIRGITKVRPPYSLVLPAEGSRIYTPPSPTVLVIVKTDSDEASKSSSRGRDLEAVGHHLRTFLRASRVREDPIYSTNDVAWVSSRSMEVLRPLKPLLNRPSNLLRKEEVLNHLLRLQTANARPSNAKAFGNGGGFCLLGVDGRTFDTLSGKGDKSDEAIEAEPFNLGDSKDLLDKVVSEDSFSAKRLRLTLNRASLDFDALVLLEAIPGPEEEEEGIEAVCFRCHDSDRRLGKLKKELEREAASRARIAGSGPGSHPWPSSLESPLAGESELWRGLKGPGTLSSLRWPLLAGWFRYALISGLFQRRYFDHGIRQIPVSLVSLGKSAEQSVDSDALGSGTKDFFDWLEGIPRVYSRVFARGGYPTKAEPIFGPVRKCDCPDRVREEFEGGSLATEAGRCPDCGGQISRKPEKILFIGGHVASGKSILALKLRQKLAQEHRAQWEVVRPDNSNNLFFQLLNLDEPLGIDEAEGDYSLFRTEGNAVSDARIAVEVLMQETFLLEVTSRLGYELSNGASDGIIVEYWPKFSGNVMAPAHLRMAIKDEERADVVVEHGGHLLSLTTRTKGPSGLKFRAGASRTSGGDVEVKIFKSEWSRKQHALLDNVEAVYQGRDLNDLERKINGDRDRVVEARFLTSRSAGTNVLEVGTGGTTGFAAPRDEERSEIASFIDACEAALFGPTDEVVMPRAIILVAEETSAIVGRNADRKNQRRNEKLGEDYINGLEEYLRKLLVNYGLDQRAIPDQSSYSLLPEAWRGKGSRCFWRFATLPSLWSQVWSQHVVGNQAARQNWDRSAIHRIQTSTGIEVFLVRDGQCIDIGVGKPDKSDRSEFGHGLSKELAKILHKL